LAGELSLQAFERFVQPLRMSASCVTRQPLVSDAHRSGYDPNRGPLQAHPRDREQTLPGVILQTRIVEAEPPKA